MLYKLAKDQGFTDTAENHGAIENITPYDIFFNQFQILDINVFDLKSVDSSSQSITYSIRENVAIWYYAMKLIACITLLIGIRMAISTVARRKS